MNLLKNSNIPKRLQNTCTLCRWKQDEYTNFDKLLRLVDHTQLEDNWLFINGSAGTGKTFAAIIACQIAIAREKSVYFTGVPELMQDLRPNPEDPEKPHRVMKACKNADLLVLDDIGHEKSSQWVREQLYLIINNRWNNGKPIIFTSNFAIENLKDSVSPAVYSRVKGESFDLRLPNLKDRRIYKQS